MLIVIGHIGVAEKANKTETDANIEILLRTVIEIQM